MNHSLKSFVALALTLVMLISMMPESLAAIAGSAQQPAANSAKIRELPVQTMTPLQRENASAAEALLEKAGNEEQDGMYRFRPLPDGTAVLTGYDDDAAVLTIPFTVMGYDVVAIGPDAFGTAVRQVTVHGNVLYMADNALPDGASVAAWQGSYAAAWADTNGHPLVSKTEGILFSGVVDMTDVLDRVTVVSDSEVAVGALEARRLADGDVFILNRGGGDEQFFTVTGRQGGYQQVWFTVRKTDISEVYSYRVYEGEKTSSASFADTLETGVDLTAVRRKGGGVYVHDPIEETKYLWTPNISVKVGKNGKFSFSYSREVKTTTVYRVVIENGKVQEGTMAVEEEATNTIEAKYKYGKNFYPPENGSASDLGTDGESRQNVLSALKSGSGKSEKKLGGLTVPLIPAVGLSLDFSWSVGWEIGGFGTYTWTDRKVSKYSYVPDKNAWGTDPDDTQELNAPPDSGSLTIYGRVSASVKLKVLCFGVTSELEVKLTASLSLNLTVPVDPDACTVFTVSLSCSFSIEVGLWLTFKTFGVEAQLVSLAKKEKTYFDATLLETHYNKKQHSHSPKECAYSPEDYCIRFLTDTDWQPNSICYLLEDAYYKIPVEVELFTFGKSTIVNHSEKTTAYTVQRIIPKEGKISTALNGRITPPQAPDSTNPVYVKWRLTEPAPLGGYYWNENISVKDNLTAATGKTYETIDDWPAVITLTAEWSDMLFVDFDANGGSFPGNINNQVLTKPCVPGTVCEKPTVQPIKSMSRFDRWTLDLEGHIPWDSSVKITENLRVYAQYEDFNPIDGVSSINAQYGSSPTILSADSTEYTTSPTDYGRLDLTLTVDGEYPDTATLNAILLDGVDAYQAAHPEEAVVCSSPFLRCVKGNVSYEGIVSLTGLVDETQSYVTCVIPSTINGMTVAPEATMMQKLRAEVVVFAAAPTENSYNSVLYTEMFRNNDYIHAVYLNSTAIVAVGNDAFNGCKNLECVVLPGTLQEIGTRAFQGCEKLETASFGLRVDTIGWYAFDGCTSLTEVHVDTPYMKTMKNAFRDSTDTSAHITLTLEDRVLVLPSEAFLGCSALKKLTINNSSRLTEIGNKAFENSGLEEMQLNEGLQSIGARAFANTRMTEVVIPKSVVSYYVPEDFNNQDMNVFFGTPVGKMTIGGNITSIPEYMFTFDYSTSVLQEIVLRKGVTEIGNNALRSYMGSGGHRFSCLQKVTLPDTLTVIGEYAFADDSALENIGLDPNHQQASLVLPERVGSIPKCAFSGCSALKKLEIPASSMLSEIKDKAFEDSGLQEIKLNEGLQSIGARAFANTQLTEVVIPKSVVSYYVPEDFNSRNMNVFFGTPIQKITIGGNIMSIPQYMFTFDYTTSVLQEIVLREGVTEIMANAIRSYTGSGGHRFSCLQKVTLPDTLTKIGEYAFADDSALEKIGLDPNHQQAGLVLPEGIGSIPKSAFNGCTGLSSAVIPGSVWEIGNSAFANSGLKQVELNEGLLTIDEFAFGNTQLTVVVIPASVTNYYVPANQNYMARNIFFGTPLVRITIGGEITKIPRYMFAFDYVSIGLQEIVLRNGVTEIERGALRSDQVSGGHRFPVLNKVTLPATLTVIGEYAFADDSALTKIGVDPDHQQAGLVLPEGIESVPEGAFTGCTGLSSAVIPGSVQEIGKSAFAGSGLEQVELNEGLRTIGALAFANTQLTEVEIPASVTSYFVPNLDTYNNNVFYNTPVRKITIGGSMTSIPRDLFTFQGMYIPSSVQEIVLREGVTEIAQNAFRPYSSTQLYPDLIRISLPASLTMIGNNAFYNVPGLTEVITGPNLSSIGDNAFYNTHPVFYALPGTAANSWLSAWCLENGFTYAPDQALKIRVYFDSGLGNLRGGYTEADLCGLIPEPSAPQREGWVFLGWFRGDAQEPWNFEEDRAGATDLTLTARWARENANGLYHVEDGHAVLLSYALSDGDVTAVTVPPEWQGYPVTAIADGAFSGEPVTRITLPAAVTEIGAAAFEGADALSWISVQKGNPAFSARNGILYSADGTELIFCPAGRKVSEFTVPDGVTLIGDGAFAGHEELQKVTFNEELTAIGEAAFRDCGLKELVLPDGVTDIGAEAFMDCGDLQSVSGAAGCLRIGSNAFASTGLCVFYGSEGSALVLYAVQNNRYYNLYTVHYLLDGQEVLQYRVNAGESVPRITPEAPEGRVTVSRWYTDDACTQLWDADTQTMPMEDLTLYMLSLPLFETAEYLPDTSGSGEMLPAGVRVTGYNGGGQAVTVPAVIGGLAVYAVNAAAFETGSAVTLPDSLAEIDVAAFTAANITLYAPAGSVTEQLLLSAGYQLNAAIRSLRFDANGGAAVAGLRTAAGSSVTLPGAVRDGSQLLGWYLDEELTLPAGAPDESFVMPDADTILYASWEGEAPDWPFLWEQRENTIVITGSRQAASVTIPATVNGLPVTAIDEYAFSGDAALTELILPEGLSEIGDFAFYGTGLVSVTLPAAVTDVGRYAFASCGKLASFGWSAAAPDLSAGVFCGDSGLANLFLPEGVVSIGSYALESCASLTGLTLPDSVVSVGRCALRNMTGLTVLTLGRNTADLSADALDGCSALENILVADGNASYESVNGVLYDTDRAKVIRYPAGAARVSYTVEASAVRIGSRAFAEAKNLQSVSLPGGLLEIGSEAFRSSSLTAADLSGLTELTDLSMGVFADCRMLADVSLPAGLNTIRMEAFRRCASLRQIDLPDSVSVIADRAFDEDVLLLGGESTEAQRYARSHGLAFRLRSQTVIPVEEIVTVKDSLILLVNTVYYAEAEIIPANATEELVWFSSDPDILRADDGWIRPLTPGAATVTVYAGDAEVTIPVQVVSSSFELIQPARCVYSGAPMQLGVRFVADNAPASEIQWTCDGASVTENGLLSVTETGVATVTASAPDGSRVTGKAACIRNDRAVRLPASTRSVEEEAFRGNTSAECFIIPSGVNEIDGYAFAECTALKIVIIQAPAAEISGSAFDGSSGVTIVCNAGSSAETFAKDHSIDVLTLP